jgi:hypothetical protein
MGLSKGGNSGSRGDKTAARDRHFRLYYPEHAYRCTPPRRRIAFADAALAQWRILRLHTTPELAAQHEPREQQRSQSWPPTDQDDAMEKGPRR